MCVCVHTLNARLHVRFGVEFSSEAPNKSTATLDWNTPNWNRSTFTHLIYTYGWFCWAPQLLSDVIAWDSKSCASIRTLAGWVGFAGMVQSRLRNSQQSSISGQHIQLANYNDVAQRIWSIWLVCTKHNGTHRIGVYSCWNCTRFGRLRVLMYIVTCT